METKVNCPYCGNEIFNEAEQCPHCKEFFVEPHIKGLQGASLLKFIIFEILTFGLYSLLWMTFNNSALKKIATKVDYRKFISCYLFFFVSIVGIWFWNIPCFLILRKIFALLLSYRSLRIIEKYAARTYRAPITHNEIGWLFFDIMYVVYFLEMFAERVNLPTKQYHLDTKGWVGYSFIALLTGALLVLFVLFASFGNISP